MMDREQKIIKAILEVLDTQDAQIGEVLLHAEVNLRIKPNAMLGEFEKCLRLCADPENRWIIGIHPRLGGATKWNISDAGRAALIEM